MIKKSVFENELINGMQRELQSYDKKQGMNNLIKAIEYLHAAAEICEESGLISQSDRILAVLYKIAKDEQDARGKPNKPKNPTKIPDSHHKGLTSEQMLENLKHHGTMLADDGSTNVDLKELVEDITDKGGAFNMAFNVPENQEVDDLLNIDIDNNDVVEMQGTPSPDKIFEDSD